MAVGKFRPALVVAVVPGRYPDLLLALISSRIEQAIPDFDEIIELLAEDYGETGLKVRSVVHLARLATVDSAVINARLGNISSERLIRVRKRLSDWLQQ